MLLPKINILFPVMLVALTTGTRLSAQIEIDRPVVLIGTDTSSNQLRNVGHTKDSSQLVSAATYQMGELYFANASATSADSILLTSDLQLNTYKQGMQFTFSVPANTHDSVYVNVNGLGWKEVTYKKLCLNPATLKAGQMLHIAFDGTDMQILNEIKNTCPLGFVEVNPGYCIEVNENGPVNFFDAALQCGEKNARLCSWNEWYFACQKAGLGLLNTTNNYEWVSDASNSNNQVLILGNGNCTTRTITLNSTTQRFRCCYSK